MAEVDPRALLLEALLFTQNEPVPLAVAGEWLETDESGVRQAAEALAAHLQGHSIQLIQVAGGLKLQTRPQWDAALHQRLSQERPEPLSHGAWETLAVVAYRQPVTRLEIEEIRQVHTERTLATLLDRGLIEECGRKETPGRPILYATTPRFLEQFGLDDVNQLPPL